MFGNPTEPTREEFVDIENWSVAKKTGNLYVRCFGHTYTIVRATEEGTSSYYRAVVVGAGGSRIDVEKRRPLAALFEALWPSASAQPLSTKV